MFFPERIVSIGKGDRVLDVGPGSQPHPRAEVYLERRIEDPAVAFAQRGNRNGVADDRRTVFYDGGRFPFDDQAFDYVICSHVLEHIPPEELAGFVSELHRVGRAGYVECPNVFYELINYQPVHRWLMNLRDGVVLLLDKSRFRSSFVHRAYREMFYGPDDYAFKMFHRYKEFYFFGFEWRGRFSYRIVTEIDALVNEEDYRRVRSFFASRRPDRCGVA